MANRKLIYYIFLSTIAISLLVLYFVFLPFIKSINDTKNIAETKREELFSLQKRERRLKSLASDYNDYKSKIDILNSLFPNQKNISQYITQIQNAGQRNAVEIVSLKVLAPSQQTKKPADTYTQMTKKGELYELSMELTINSDDYSNVVNMVKTMEQVSRYTNISKVTIKKEAGNANQTSTVINFKIYVL